MVLARTKWVEHGRSASEIQQGGCRHLLMLCLQEGLVLDLGYGLRGECATVHGRLGSIQLWLAGPLRALVHGQTLAQVLHLLLHLGIAVALAHALEVWLDDASQVLFLAAGAANKRVLLDVALELEMAG